MAKQDISTERTYTSHSKDYDEQRFYGPTNEYLERIRFASFNSLHTTSKDSTILDVGCGTGRGSLALAKGNYRSVIGMDFTHAMLLRAIDKKQQLDITNASFARGNAKSLPFNDNSFDSVVSFNFIHMFGMTPQRLFIDEMIRVLKPEGTLIVEFDSFYKAIFMGGLVQKQKPRTHFNKPSDIKLLFDSNKVNIVNIYGALIPYIWRVFRHFPTSGIFIEKITKYFPFNFLAERFFVKAIKKIPGT